MGVGVCQDQAHVFIACCRAAGVPGTLRQRLHLYGRVGRSRESCVGRRVAGRRCRLGESRRDARRAPGHGHCRLAVGRDYLDAAPVRGVRRGGGREAMSVAVRLAPFGSNATSQAQQHQQQ